MASLDSQKQARQPRAGIIRTIFNFISNALPHHQTKAKSASESANSARASSSSSEAKTKTAATKNSKKQVRASHGKTQAKTKNHAAPVKAKSVAKSASASSARRKQKKHAAPQVERTEHNPKDVIPGQPHDPAHSPGHRRVHIEKELH